MVVYIMLCFFLGTVVLIIMIKMVFDNFKIPKEVFENKLEVMVKKKQSVELVVEEGWYTEAELKDEVGWNQFIP